jgi:glycosyltransferase involved in cell wall biosynthesis
MRAALLVPAPLATISGGYIYDRKIIAASRAAGHAVDVQELAGTHPLADAQAEAAARAAWNALPEGAVPVIDGLGLPAFAPLADALAARHSVGLIHHPTSHETGLPEADRARLHDIEAALLPRLARIIVTSEATATQLATEFGVDKARIAVVVPGTDDAPRSTGSGGPGCAILSVGTLIPRKGHDMLIRALTRLFDLDWHLTIAGAARDEVYAHSLRALAELPGAIGRVRFVGESTGAALESLWQHADLFALATHYEGYGMVVAEALKRGLPVAVTSGGAAGALVTPEAGVVCAPGDEVTFSKALRRLIFDVALRRDTAEAAFRIGGTLPSWTTQARAFADALT